MLIKIKWISLNIYLYFLNISKILTVVKRVLFLGTLRHKNFNYSYYTMICNIFYVFCLCSDRNGDFIRLKISSKVDEFCEIC